MSSHQHSAASVPGHEHILIRFPEAGTWQELGQWRDLGPCNGNYCTGNLSKTADNQLYLYLKITSWPGLCIKEFMPFHLPDEGKSTLYIRWEETGVHLRLDNHPAIEAAWKPLRQAPPPS